MNLCLSRWAGEQPRIGVNVILVGRLVSSNHTGQRWLDLVQVRDGHRRVGIVRVITFIANLRKDGLRCGDRIHQGLDFRNRIHAFAIVTGTGYRGLHRGQVVCRDTGDPECHKIGLAHF